MAFASRHSNGGDDDIHQPMAEINVTALIDVMLVLLIIFMVSAPMLASGMKVELPQAKSSQPLENQQPVVVTVGPDGSLNVGGDVVTRDGLVEAVKAQLAGRPVPVQVRGDRASQYGEVVNVLDLLAANGIVKIALVTNRQNAEPAAAKPN